MTGRVLPMLLLLLMLTLLTSCADDVWSGEDIILLTRPAETTLPPEAPDSQKSALLPETTALSASSPAPETEPPAPETWTTPGIVYWVDGGSVWHLSPDCSSLRRSKNVRSGAEEQAHFAGKSRVCKRCGGAETEAAAD